MGVDWGSVRKLAGHAATAAAAVPVLTGLGLMGAEKIRRARYPLDKPFPVTPPVTHKTGRNITTVYTYGRDVYDAMLADIELAQHTIYFETFIWKADQTG
ncbi:MAG: phosphatidylserine/phosphatidylglycerophosphate/cardiolipin synthase family protein, partial [Promicromonosporaceae bacterium]|nr:phosphatidylserine/phosphatidylglycerophosphate/cardiolipin synthase family protein [Promicromonosporaceae bacterium]